MATQAIAALPLIEQAGRGALQLAQTPVLGWERVQSYTKGRKRPVSIVERSSVQVHAWELAALGFVGVVVLWALQAQKATATANEPWTWTWVPFPFNLIVR